MLRRFLVFATSVAWLAGCGGQSTTPTVSSGAPQGVAPAPLRPDANRELPEPPVVDSVHGVAKVSLIVNLSGHTGFPQFTYQGYNETAPTIRVNPGDRIVIDESDFLPPAQGDRYDINIHFHGIGSSPNAPGDDVLGTLARSGQSLHYVVRIPKNQEPGLYWYHPHVHGETNYQVGEGGMSGAIVVNGLERHFPRLAKMTEHVMVVRATGNGEAAMPSDSMGMELAKPSVINNEPCGPELGLTTTLNGVYHPNITIAPGEKQFWRVINATGHKTLKLAVDGSELTVYAIDGFALDTYHGTSPITEPYAIVPPAARVEFVVTGPRSRSAKFRTLCFDSGPGGDRDPQLVLARLEPPRHAPSALSMASGRLAPAQPLPSNVYTTPLPPIAATRTVTFSEGNKYFLINGKVFSMQDPPLFVVHVGTVEEWHVNNVTSEVHDFHIHQLHFLVKEIDGVKLAHPYWADSQVIPHRDHGKPGSLVLLMDFRDPVIRGTFLFHCHILDHEDHGMMAKIQAI
jgi:FtsP/CotA-like multicopper oxidase with cupredoxin domain